MSGGEMVGTIGELARAEHPRWYAAYTMPRHEKSAARQLEGRSVECFLPLYRVTRSWQHRRGAFDLPLFPSYVFVRMNRDDRVKVLTAPGVVYLVSTKGVPDEIEGAEIESLRGLLATRNAYPTPYVEPGRRVRFLAGPFAGLEGTVVRTKGQVRVVVSVDTIMRSISIEVDCNELGLARPGNDVSRRLDQCVGVTQAPRR